MEMASIRERNRKWQARATRLGRKTKVRMFLNKQDVQR